MDNDYRLMIRGAFRTVRTILKSPNPVSREIAMVDAAALCKVLASPGLVDLIRTLPKDRELEKILAVAFAHIGKALNEAPVEWENAIDLAEAKALAEIFPWDADEDAPW